MRIVTAFLLTLVAFASGPAAQTGAAYVVSQGAFGATNANVVRVASDGTATTFLADRPYTQGAEIIDGRLYLTAGGGTDSRVDVVDLETGQQVAQATGDLVNPRYLAEVAEGIAFVTNQTYSYVTTADPYLSVLDLATNAVVGTISVARQPEGIAAAAGRAYVALGGFDETDSLAVVDVAARTLSSYLDIDCYARFVFADEDDEIIAVCADEFVVLDAATGLTKARVEAPSAVSVGFAQEATYDATTETVFAVSGTDVLVFDTATNQFGPTVSVADERTISAIGFDPSAGRLILGRPDPDNPYSAAGAVTVHETDGTLVSEAAAGVYPTYVAVHVAGSVASEPVAESALPALQLAGPNPATAATALSVRLDAPAAVRLTLVDALGREVAVLADRTLAAGTTRVALDASRLPAGRYLARLQTDRQSAAVPLTVAR